MRFSFKALEGKSMPFALVIENPLLLDEQHPVEPTEEIASESPQGELEAHT